MSYQKHGDFPKEIEPFFSKHGETKLSYISQWTETMGPVVIHVYGKFVFDPCIIQIDKIVDVLFPIFGFFGLYLANAPIVSLVTLC